MEKWNFPSSKGLGVNGASDSGVETFKGNLIGSLAREICQNSLDASLHNGKPVKVSFKTYSDSNSLIPGYEELKKVFINGCQFWDEMNNTKAKNFFRNGIDILNKDVINYLVISDYETKGLVGSTEYDKITPWSSMVTSEGVSNKSGYDGGSFGIGKSSIYAVSSLQTAFINTYDINEIKAIQGISKLPSFKMGDDLKFGKGYYGKFENSEIKPMSICDNVEKLLNRTTSGTDIVVLGFREISNWNEQIICSLLDNFLLAIYDSKLELEVQSDIINSNNLIRHLNKYSSHFEIQRAKRYYDVLISKETKIIRKKLFDDLNGEVVLKILLSQDESNRKILVSRSNGMKLFDKDRISGNIQFNAILSMKGEDLNSFFSKMENPAHNGWEPDRYEEDSLIQNAKNKRDYLFRWAKQEILKIGEENFGDEIDVEGLDGLLPEFYNFGTNNNEYINDKTKEIYTKPRLRNTQTIEKAYPSKESSLFEIEDVGLLDVNGDYDSKGLPINETNDNDGGNGALAIATHGDGNRPIKEFKQINKFKKRIFINNVEKGEYNLILSTHEDIYDCRIEVLLSAESKNVDCPIEYAFLLPKNRKLEIKNGKIIIGYIKKETSYKIVFKIDIPYLCSLGVKLYANNK